MIGGDLLNGTTIEIQAEVNKTSDNIFNAAKAGYTYLHAYLNVASQEFGRERALSLMTRVGDKIGVVRGKMMKERAGLKDFDAKAAWSQIKILKDNIGQPYEVVEEGSQMVAVKNGRCPIYEAAQTLGIEHNAIEAVCRAGTVRLMDTAIKQLNPNLSIRLTKFRSSAGDFCREEVVLL
jgi:hypothetical protein